MTTKPMKGATVYLSKPLRSKVTVGQLHKLYNSHKSTSGNSIIVVYVIDIYVLCLSISCSNAVLVQLMALYPQQLMATCEVVRGCPSVTFDEYGRAHVL
jgi:hypothetical protein